MKVIVWKSEFGDYFLACKQKWHGGKDIFGPWASGQTPEEARDNYIKTRKEYVFDVKE